MKSKLSLTLMVLSLCNIAYGQSLKTNIFLRTPQVVNYNFNQQDINYNSVISIGTGLSHISKFVELAAFINDDDIYGFYTFFGKTLKDKTLGSDWKLFTNVFGEITYVPKQSNLSGSFTYTTGICFSLNYSFDWGSIGIPLCLGAAYNQKTISLNTRTILNLSLLLN